MTSNKKIDLSAIESRYKTYFMAYGSSVFASTLAQMPFLDLEFAENLALNVVSDREILSNASYQGDIGATREQLPDAHSRKEHGNVDFEKSAATLVETRQIAQQYKLKHGIKYMVFASGKTAEEMLEILKSRVDRPTSLEWAEARSVMFKIFLRRIGEVSYKYVEGGATSSSNNDDEQENANSATAAAQTPVVKAHELMETLFKRHAIDSATVTATWGSSASASHPPQEISWSTTTSTKEEEENDSHWHFGSAGKIIATTFCLEYFAQNNIPLNANVNKILESVKSSFRLNTGANNVITLEDLLFPGNNQFFSVSTTRPIVALRSSTQFPQSGTPLTNAHLLEGLIQVTPITSDSSKNNNNNQDEAGLLICQHIIQSHVKKEDDKSLSEVTSGFFRKCGVSGYLFYPSDQHKEDEESVECLALGLRGSESISKGFHTMLLHLVNAYHNVNGSGGVSHDTARRVLYYNNDNINSSSSSYLRRFGVDNKFIVIAGGDNNEKSKYFIMQCYDGADTGKGFAVSSLSDGFNAEFAANGCCQALAFRGFDFYGALTQHNSPSSPLLKSEKLPVSNQSEFYESELLQFFAKPSSSSASSSNIITTAHQHQHVAEEFVTSPEEVASRFALLGYGSDSQFNATSIEFGAEVIYSAEKQHEQLQDEKHKYLIMARRALNPRPPLSMLDGFLNNDHPRSPSQHSEDLTISLHHPVSIFRIEIDFTFFSSENADTSTNNKNVVPDEIEIVGLLPELCHQQQQQEKEKEKREIQLVPKTIVKHFAGSVKVFEISASSLNHVPVETIVVKNYPGGGFNRIKCFAKRSFF